MEPLLTIFNAGLREAAVSPRYYHNNMSEARAPRVVVQWTRSGYGVHEDAGGRHLLPAEYAFVMILPKDVKYYYPKEATEPWVFDWVDFVGPLAMTLFGGFCEKFGSVILLRKKGVAAIHFHRTITAALSRGPRDRWEESREAYAFLTEWWREALRADEDDNIIETVLSLCQTTPYRLMTVKELAAECGMSREHFTRMFTRQLGISPATWLRQRRLTVAATLLREDAARPLALVARESGFATARQLMAAFRRAYGMTTEDYRRR